MEGIDFYAPGTCQLCQDSETVEVLPPNGQGNDAELDECPWCLRRKLHSAEQVTKDLAILVRRIVAEPTPKNLERAWNYLGRKGLQGSISRQPMA